MAEGKRPWVGRAVVDGRTMALAQHADLGVLVGALAQMLNADTAPKPDTAVSITITREEDPF